MSILKTTLATTIITAGMATNAFADINTPFLGFTITTQQGAKNDGFNHIHCAQGTKYEGAFRAMLGTRQTLQKINDTVIISKTNNPNQEGIVISNQGDPLTAYKRCP